MIYEKLENIYPLVPEEIKSFIKSLNKDTPVGKYELTPDCYVNVEEYETKDISQRRFESHRKYADIQIIIEGEERLDFTDDRGVGVPTTFDEAKDIMFYDNINKRINTIYLDGTNFFMLFPGDIHAPQIAVDKPMHVKKAVIKIAQN